MEEGKTALWLDYEQANLVEEAITAHMKTMSPESPCWAILNEVNNHVLEILKEG